MPTKNSTEAAVSGRSLTTCSPISGYSNKQSLQDKPREEYLLDKKKKLDGLTAKDWMELNLLRKKKAKRLKENS